ncbi:hypothetical protein Ancab_033330 [Ancistrocladus abbreviatus]
MHREEMWKGAWEIQELKREEKTRDQKELLSAAVKTKQKEGYRCVGLGLGIEEWGTRKRSEQWRESEMGHMEK